jgi:hypothetical protein
MSQTSVGYSWTLPLILIGECPSNSPDIIPEGRRRKCAVCADRNNTFRKSRISTWCSTCGVGLCVRDCFRKFHAGQEEWAKCTCINGNVKRFNCTLRMFVTFKWCLCSGVGYGVLLVNGWWMIFDLYACCLPGSYQLTRSRYLVETWHDWSSFVQWMCFCSRYMHSLFSNSKPHSVSVFPTVRDVSNSIHLYDCA